MKPINQNRFLLLAALVVLTGVVALQSCNSGNKESAETDQLAPKVMEKIVGEEVAVLTTPPMVPPPITRKTSTKVIVKLEIIEKEMRMADGVTYTFWTYGGSVPGKFIRVREGDFVEFHLENNPNNKLPHNIDLHAVTGQGGGAAASFTAPGHESVFSFTAINPGLYVYHCATAPVGMHIANGMYGLILVEPKEGMTPVDKEFYVMQGDFYTKGSYGESGHQSFNMDKALTETPDYVLFNGSVGSLTGDNALKAKVGEKIRLFVGNGGPNLISSFHVIGEIFDNVYPEGGNTQNHQVQTTIVPSGGSAITEFRVDVPGNYILVDHSIFRTFNKGSLGILKVDGEGNKDIYSGKLDDRIYQPESGASQSMPDEAKATEFKAKNKEERVTAGKAIFTANCQPCHQVDGKGIANAFPPLAGSDYLNANPLRALGHVLNGFSGEVTVNGVKYNGVMPKQTISDEAAANVVTYVLNSFGNKGGEVKPEQAKSARK